jgi:FMN-dependent NADH-azoreductase
MRTLLHLDAGANRTEESVSRRLTRLFADTWRTAPEPRRCLRRDLAADPVPPIDTAFCALGRGLERDGLRPLPEIAAAARTGAERRAWAVTRPLIEELLSADTVLIGTPMYNFGIPAALKAWIDRVTFPGALTDPLTGEPALRDTHVVLVCTRGGAYGPGTPRAPMDFQVPYLRAWFAAYGVPEDQLHIVTAELTLAHLAPHLADLRPLAAASLATAQAELTRLATQPPTAPSDAAKRNADAAPIPPRTRPARN